jgi:alkanesulfonate monooxygenase SsuD/methylene tetrahydromethanopterin reductase-like flavin-dependent oxidoreductase (luciferase family)
MGVAAANAAAAVSAGADSVDATVGGVGERLDGDVDVVADGVDHRGGRLPDRLRIARARRVRERDVRAAGLADDARPLPEVLIGGAHRVHQRRARVDAALDRAGDVLAEQLQRLHAALAERVLQLDVGGVDDHLDLVGIDFERGEQVRDLSAVQEEPPIHVISNPAHHDSDSDDVLNRAAWRIVELGSGWMASGLGAAPDKYEQQWNMIKEYAEENGYDPDGIQNSFQVTMTIDDDEKAANQKMEEYIRTYYPQLYEGKDPLEWGPSGDADVLIDWIQDFYERGNDEFIIRFGGSDAGEQMEQFVDEVIPSFR